MKKTILITFIICTLLLLSGCFEHHSKSASVYYGKLSPEEQGIIELIGPAIGYIVLNSNQAEESVRIWNREKNNEGWWSEFQASFHRTRFLNCCKNLGKVLEYPIPDGPRILVPNSQEEIVQKMRDFLFLKGKVNTRNPDLDDRNLLRDYALEIVEADIDLAAFYRNRSSTHTDKNFSHNLTLEIASLPFKIDFAKGEVKLKHSHTIGPFKLGAAVGPKRRTGVKTLIIQNSKYRRYYAVGGRVLELRIPASVLEVEGEVMTITAIE